MQGCAEVESREGRLQIREENRTNFAETEKRGRIINVCVFYCCLTGTCLYTTRPAAVIVDDTDITDVQEITTEIIIPYGLK